MTSRSGPGICEDGGSSRDQRTPEEPAPVMLGHQSRLRAERVSFEGSPARKRGCLFPGAQNPVHRRRRLGAPRVPGSAPAVFRRCWKDWCVVTPPAVHVTWFVHRCLESCAFKDMWTRSGSWRRTVRMATAAAVPFESVFCSFLVTRGAVLVPSLNAQDIHLPSGSALRNRKSLPPFYRWRNGGSHGPHSGKQGWGEPG